MKLLLVCLLLAGCGTCPTQYVPSKPPSLEAALAKPCTIPDAPTAPDYDVLLAWVIDDALAALGDCAVRHDATVRSWPH